MFMRNPSHPSHRRPVNPSHRRLVSLCLVWCALVAVVGAQGLGTAIAESDVAGWDIAVLPDGTNLPPGSGTPQQGAVVYAAKCQVCHGPEGKGGTNAALVGGEPLTNGIDTTKTVANFWPHATTLFDFIRRAMPWQQPRTLTDDEVYALTAYILALNEIIGENDAMNEIGRAHV